MLLNFGDIFTFHPDGTLHCIYTVSTRIKTCLAKLKYSAAEKFKQSDFILH